MNTKTLLFYIAAFLEGRLEARPLFYGTVGPRFPLDIACPLYYTLTRPGIIQGVFFDNENSYIRPVFRTLDICHSVANTAMIQVKDKFYAMYERDCPVEIKIDYAGKSLKDHSRIDYAGICSGHTKWNGTHLESLSYHWWSRNVNFSVFDSRWKKVRNHSVKIPYPFSPMVHDYIRLDGERILFSVSNLFSSMGMENKMERTLFLVMNTEDGSVQYHFYDSNIMIFHYADCKRMEGHWEVFASAYNEVNLCKSARALQGYYSKFIVPVVEGGREEGSAKGAEAVSSKGGRRTVMSETTNTLQQYNLDFPVKMGGEGDKDAPICVRSVTKDGRHRYNKLVICRGLEIIREIPFPERMLCCEPAYDEEACKLYGLSWQVDNPSVVFFWECSWPSCVVTETRLRVDKPLFYGFHSGLYKFA